MLVFEYGQGANRGGVKQRMFRVNGDRRLTDMTGNQPHSQNIVEYSRFGAGRSVTDLDFAITYFLGQLRESERQVLGIAALLGVEVSVHEVARVADRAPGEVAIACAQAVAQGLIVEEGEDHVSFVHEDVRNAALASLDPSERLAAHARAAKLLTGSTPERMLRRTHHAFTAARRSTEDAVTAVHIARETAAALQAAGDFEQAAVLLGRAVELHDAAALSGSCAGIVAEHAEAVLACGQLAEARPLFHRAAQLAETEGDPVILARAALGLGGVWVREHRMTEEAERVGALQRRALESLPPDATVLRTRLSMRLAAESAYRGGPVTAVVEGMETARRTGDARAVAEALSLYHHALMTAEHSKSRLAVANELIAVGSGAGDRLLSLMGLCWRAADLFLLGDPSAKMALTELRLRADTLHCQSVLFIVQAMEVMLAIRAGQFEQAERAAAACYTLGSEVGDADALAYYGAHLAAIRVFQGREAEIADTAASIAASPTLTERDRTFSSAAALFALRAGQPSQARATLERLTRDGLRSIIPTSAWLVTMQAITELAAALNDRQNAQATYDLLLPYAELPIMASLAIVCFGSVHRPLALAALTCGKVDLAIAHLEAAVAANERLEHRPAAVQAQAELALALLRRNKPGDSQRGRLLLDEALTEGDTFGMTGLTRRWREALATTQKLAVPEEKDLLRVSTTSQGGWQVALGNQLATVPDLVGMRYVAQLVAAPNQDIPAVALVAETDVFSGATSKQEVMDSATVNAVRERIRELRQRPILTPHEQEELDTLIHELASTCGLGGRRRAFADMAERARTAVQKAVKRALEYVSAANPVIGRHLAKRIETGAVCRYRVLGQERH